MGALRGIPLGVAWLLLVGVSGEETSFLLLSKGFTKIKSNFFCSFSFFFPFSLSFSSFYTHSYILKGEDRPRCVGCDEVKHILLDCVDFSDQRPRFHSSL